MTHAQPQRNTNKVLVGCLVAFAALLVIGGGAVYYFIGRPLLATFNVARDLSTIQQLDSSVTNRSNFAAPSDGLVTEQQLSRYLAVSRQVTNDLQAGMSAIEELHREVSAGSSSTPSFAGFRQAAAAWTDLLKLVLKAKETQVNALNSNGFSLAEYRWVRSQVMAAAGLAIFEVDLSTLLQEDSNPAVRRATATVPQANVELVAPHIAELEKLLPLSALGL